MDALIALRDVLSLIRTAVRVRPGTPLPTLLVSVSGGLR
jgi:hypothetical protein